MATQSSSPSPTVTAPLHSSPTVTVTVESGQGQSLSSYTSQVDGRTVFEADKTLHRAALLTEATRVVFRTAKGAASLAAGGALLLGLVCGVLLTGWGAPGKGEGLSLYIPGVVVACVAIGYFMFRAWVLAPSAADISTLIAVDDFLTCEELQARAIKVAYEEWASAADGADGATVTTVTTVTAVTSESEEMN